MEPMGRFEGSGDSGWRWEWGLGKDQNPKYSWQFAFVKPEIGGYLSKSPKPSTLKPFLGFLMKPNTLF